MYASSIPTIPIQVLATTGSYSGASVVFHSNVAKTLLADGTNLASKLCAKFQTTSPQFQYQGTSHCFATRDLTMLGRQRDDDGYEHNAIHNN